MISEQASVSVVANPNLSKLKSSTCLCCKIKFESTELQRTHFKSEWHRYNLKRKVCNLEPIDLDNYNAIQAVSPLKQQQQKDDETSSVSSSNSVDLPTKSPVQSGRIAGSNSNDDEEDWASINDDELLDEEYDDDDVEEMLARVVKSCTCLFCDKKNSNTENNINHMNLMHGFFIPEEQYMIDLAGFMEYLGFKVGAGATCLWCNKQFTSVHGVRRHMINKDHCKILYDQEKSLEFKEFYDYSTQEKIPMKPINELVVVKRRHERRSNITANGSSSGKLQTALGREQNKSALVKRNGQSMIVCGSQARAYKKFDAYRAKILLRTGMANNQTMRGRLRQQNPI